MSRGEESNGGGPHREGIFSIIIIVGSGFKIDTQTG